MSMQEVREQNIALVTQTALACFVENGIEKTTIRDIARRAHRRVRVLRRVDPDRHLARPRRHPRRVQPRAVRARLADVLR